MTHSQADVPLRVINGLAPVRICDIGGWTDTWFAGQGKIFNIGVSPYVEVQVGVYPLSARPDLIILNADNYGERYVIEPGQIGSEHHRLLEAAIAEMVLPEEYALEIAIHSEVTAAASTGTSAA